jgi:hypothetical protein
MKKIGYKFTCENEDYSGEFDNLEDATNWYNKKGYDLENYYFGGLLMKRKLKLEEIFLTKETIIELISTASLKLEFEHQFDGDQFSNNTQTIYIENELFTLDLKITERVRFSDYQEYEFENLELEDIEIYTQNESFEIEDFGLTEDEILNSLNY